MGHLNDLLGEVTTDVYGNPLCTTYDGEDPVSHEIPASALDADMLPVVDVKGGECRSDADGVVTFPHMGTNRYTQFVTAAGRRAAGSRPPPSRATTTGTPG